MVDPHSAPTRTRPGVVTLSSYLLILFAVIQVISLILTLAYIGTIRDVLRDAYSRTSANGMERVADFALAGAVGGAVLSLLLAIGLVVLAMLNNRGKNGARITTWVLGGIVVCCSGGGLVMNATGGMTGAGAPSNGDVPSGEEIQRRLDAALPSWYGPVTTLLGVLSLLALLAALILLALPKANEFFRKPQQVWEPPVPGAAYPGYPQAGHPQAPGYPPYPPAPGYPQAGQPQPPGQPGWPQGGTERPGEGGPDRPGPTPPSGS